MQSPDGIFHEKDGVAVKQKAQTLEILMIA